MLRIRVVLADPSSRIAILILGTGSRTADERRQNVYAARMRESPVIVPLDGLPKAEALALAGVLEGLVWGFKVNDLLVGEGIGIIEALKPFGRVFADPKLHDIPNTVANGIRRLESAGADLITVHASGGPAMLSQAAQAADQAKILAVTVLTSMSDAEAQRVYGSPAQDAVLHLGQMAAEAGIHGLVSSPLELEALGNAAPTAELLKVTPGVRPSWYGKQDDQRRVTTPAAAMALGAHLLVIGRPITQDPDPKAAAARINAEL